MFDVKYQQIKRLWSSMILDSEFNFEPVEGEVYYLYQTEQGKLLSLLSPIDWGEDHHKYGKDNLVGVVEYCPDNTWKLLKADS